ncbi:MAG: hypothetical protein ACI38Q_08865 [Candidatus Bruticola sp.]
MNKNVNFAAQKKKRGVALISALFVLVIMATICGGFVSIMAQSSSASRRDAEESILLYTAEAGLEYAKWCVKHNLTYYPVRDLYTASSSTVPRIKAGGLYNFWGSSAYFAFPGADVSSSNVASIDYLTRRYEYLYWTDLSYENPNQSGHKNVFDINGEKRFLTTFQISVGVVWDNAKTSSTYNNASTVNYVRAVGSSSERGFPVELVSTARLWSLKDNGQLYNAFNNQNSTYQLNLVETSKLIQDLGAVQEAARTLHCTFMHAVNADQYVNSYPKQDYYDVKMFKDYRDFAR